MFWSSISVEDICMISIGSEKRCNMLNSWSWLLGEGKCKFKTYLMSRGASSSPIFSIRSSMKEKYEWKQKSVTSRTTVQAPAIVLTVPSYSNEMVSIELLHRLLPDQRKESEPKRHNHTIKQWVSLSVTPSPTASKVAIRGTKTP